MDGSAKAGDEVTATRSDKLTFGLMLLLGSISTFAAVSIEMYLPAVPKISADLRSWPGGVEMTISTFLIALAIGQLFYGPLSDRLGRRPPLLVGLSVYAVASAACAMAVTVEQLIAFRFVQALGGCAGAVIVRAIMRDRFPSDRLVQVLSIMALVTGLAPLLAPLAGGAMLKVAPWRAILWSQAGYGALMLAMTFLFLKESAPPRAGVRHASMFAAYRAVLGNKRTMGYALTQGFSGAVIFIYGAAFPAIAMHRFGLTPVQLSLTLAGSAGAMTLCAQLNRPLLKRFTSDQVLKTVNLLSIGMAGVLCVIAWTGWFGFGGLVVPLFAIMGLRGIAMPNASASALLSEKTHIGAVSAVVGAQSFAWGAALSALSSAFTDGTPRPMAATILLSMVLAAAVLRGVALPSEIID